MRMHVKNGRDAINDGKEVLKQIVQMKKLAKSAHLNEDFTFFYDSFYAFYLIRKVLFDKQYEKTQLTQAIDEYNKQYSQRFYVHVNLSKNPIQLFFIKLLLDICIRQKKQYRLFDTYFLNTSFPAFLVKLFEKPVLKSSPMAEKVAMPLHVIFQ